jgi:hypothetical protein
MHYYAKLNENQICVEVLTRARELPKDLDGFIKINDYNETLLWRKWDGKQWSQERFEPSIEAELQEKIRELEQKTTKIEELEGTVLELTAMITALQGEDK